MREMKNYKNYFHTRKCVVFLLLTLVFVVVMVAFRPYFATGPASLPRFLPQKVFRMSKSSLRVVNSSDGLPKTPGYIRFVCLSDTHGLHQFEDILKVPEGDVLVFAGDAGLENRADVSRFNSFLSKQSHKHKLITFGNMDFWAESQEYSLTALPAASNILRGVNGEHSAQVPFEQDNSLNVTTLAESTGDGLRSEEQRATLHVVGSPFTPEFYGSFQLTSEAHAERHWNDVLQQDSQCDILITHGPPYGTADVTKGRHVGDKMLLEAVQRLASPPLLWVVGHIHASYGVYQLLHEASGKEIVVANVATNDLRHGMNTPPMVFDIGPA